MNFSPLPLTQGSQIPGGHQPYPVDNQNAHDGQYGWAPEHGSAGSGSTQPLSQIQEGNPGSRGSRSVHSHGGGGDPNVHTSYTSLEMEKIFDEYVAIGEDPEVGTNQTGDRFRFRIACMYNANQSEGTVERTESMLRNVVERANEEIQKFQWFYLEEQRSTESSTNEVDFITTSMSAYQTILYKPFKHLNTWKKVRHLSKWKGGIQSSSSKKVEVAIRLRRG